MSPDTVEKVIMMKLLEIKDASRDARMTHLYIDVLKVSWSYSTTAPPSTDDYSVVSIMGFFRSFWKPISYYFFLVLLIFIFFMNLSIWITS
jgi:hypothetical protein